MMKPIYRKDGWVLGRCTTCDRLNYVEPHGTTAKCACSLDETEHENIPYQERTDYGNYIVVRETRSR